MSAPSPQSPADVFDLRASVEGKEVVFENLELWWSEPEPPDHEYPTFTLITSADALGDGPRIEVECPAPEATTFRDLNGETFPLAPLSGEGMGGWVSVDLGRDYRAKGFPARDWVAKEASVAFDSKTDEVLEGQFEAQLEKSASKGGGAVAPIKLKGRFRARAPRW